MIKIKKIILNNYRQYKGKQEIRLDFNNKKNLNIIVGVNGSGKTNLLNALTWCLYGKEEHLAESSIHHEMLNDSVRATLKVGESAEVSVEVIFEDDEGWGFRIIRRKVFIKREKNTLSSLQEDVVAFIKLPNKTDWDQRPPKFIVNYRVLPYGVKDFFFFDGERLIKLFEEKTAEKVKSAILDVSQISLINVTLKHLEDKKQELFKESRKVSPIVEKINEKIEVFRRSLRELETQREEYKRSKQEIEKVLKDIEKRLRGYSEERVKELRERAEELEEEREKLKKEIDLTEEEFQRFLIDNGPLVLCKNALNTIEKMIKKKYEKGELPPPATEEFVKELLERGKCICGSDISSGKGRKKVEKFLETISTIATKLDEECRNIKPDLVDAIKIIRKFFTEKKELGQKLVGKQNRLVKVKENLRDVMIKLKTLKIEEIENLIEQKESYEKQYEEIIGNIATRENLIEHTKRQIKELESELKKELKKQEKLAKLNKKIEIIEKCIKVLSEVREEILEEVRSTVETTTFKYFMDLIWKKKKFKKIRIDENYIVSVIDRYGQNIVGVISAGEKEILALSFMAALRKISGFEAPIIIDTPLARISKEHRLNIAKALPQYLKDTQIVLLFTDEEYTEEVKKILELRVATKYLLQYNDEKDETKVVKWQ